MQSLVLKPWHNLDRKMKWCLSWFVIKFINMYMSVCAHIQIIKWDGVTRVAICRIVVLSKLFHTKLFIIAYHRSDFNFSLEASDDIE